MRRQEDSVPPSVQDSAPFAALPTKIPSLSLGHVFPPRNRRQALLQGGGHLEAMLVSSPRFFFFSCFLESIFQLSSCGFSRPPFGGCRPKSRATLCPRDVIDPGLFLSCSAEIASRLPCGGSRGMSLLTASPAAHAVVWPATVRYHVAKAKEAVAPVAHLSPALLSPPIAYTLFFPPQ